MDQFQYVLMLLAGNSTMEEFLLLVVKTLTIASKLLDTPNMEAKVLIGMLETPGVLTGVLLVTFGLKLEKISVTLETMQLTLMLEFSINTLLFIQCPK